MLAEAAAVFGEVVVAEECSLARAPDNLVDSPQYEQIEANIAELEDSILEICDIEEKIRRI